MVGQLSSTNASERKPSAWLASALFALLAAALLLYQVGYGFEVGDQLQYLLLPYREIYPDFLPGDWFTWHTSHYHETFAWIVHGLASVFGVEHLPQSVFALHTLSLAWFGFALLTLARALGLGLFEAAFALCGFALVRQMGLAGAVLNHGALTPADLALPPFLLACAAYARGSCLALGAWLGVAGFLHANYAVLGPAALFPLELLRRWQLRLKPRDVLQLSAAVLVYAVIASPSLYLVLSAFLVRDPAPEAVAVTLFTRSPHHYDLASMRPDEFYYAFGLSLLALPLALGQVGSAATRRRLLPLAAALLVLIGLGAAGSGLHILALCRLFTWRMSIALFALLLMAAAAGLREFAAQRQWWKVLWALALCAGLTAFAQTDPLERSPWNELPRAAALSGGLCALATFFALARWRRAVSTRHAPGHTAIPSEAASADAAAPPAAARAAGITSIDATGVAPPSPPAAARTAGTTPTNATAVAPPLAGNAPRGAPPAAARAAGTTPTNASAVAPPLAARATRGGPSTAAGGVRALGAVLAWAGAAVALSVTHSSFWQGASFKPPRGLHFLDAQIQLAAPDRALYQTVRTSTPADARFLIPPGMNQFRMAARRSIFVDWKCAPMRGDEALEWKRRFLLALGQADFPATGYQLPRAADAAYFARPLGELIQLAQSEHLTHVLTARGRGQLPGAKRVLEVGRYAVYELER